MKSEKINNNFIYVPSALVSAAGADPPAAAGAAPPPQAKKSSTFLPSKALANTLLNKAEVVFPEVFTSLSKDSTVISVELSANNKAA